MVTVLMGGYLDEKLVCLWGPLSPKPQACYRIHRNKARESHSRSVHGGKLPELLFVCLCWSSSFLGELLGDNGVELRVSKI